MPSENNFHMTPEEFRRRGHELVTRTCLSHKCFREGHDFSRANKCFPFVFPERVSAREESASRSAACLAVRLEPTGNIMCYKSCIASSRFVGQKIRRRCAI